MIELTIEQHSLALADPQTPKRVLDPVSNEVFVLLPEHTYEQVYRRLLEEGSGEIDVGRLVEDAMAEYDADDPLLASYQTAKGE
jgi:hypothetical protein